MGGRVAISSKQKYWGLGLVGLGLVAELASIANQEIPPVNDPVNQAIWVLGMLFSGMGAFLYLRSQGFGWLGITCGSVFALVPVLGPFSFCLALFTKNLLPILSLLCILGIFAAMHIPCFMTYQTKARQSEAKVGLGGIFTSATSYFAENSTYRVSDINKLGWVPQEAHKYSFWYSVNGVPAMIPGSSQAKSPCDLTTPPTSVKVVASVTGFTAAAKGNIDADSTCDEWSINDQRVLTNTVNDVSQ